MPQTSAIRDVREVLAEAVARWSDDGAVQWGGALAYYAILSLPPLILILLMLVGQVYGDVTAREELLRWTDRFFGARGIGAVLRRDRG